MATLEQLFKDLVSDDEGTRSAAAGDLEAGEGPQLDQLPWLAGLVGVDQLDVSYWAATLLGRAGQAAAPFAVQLEQAALDATHPVAARERAVWAIGKIGPAASQTSEGLRALAANPGSPRLGRLADSALESVTG